MLLFQKEREFPIRLKQGEALLRSLRPHHQKREKITKDLKKIRAGYRGEKELDYHLKFLPEKDYHIFSNLRLSFKDTVVQIDTLILSLWFAALIESKNIFGHLYFDSISKQLIRTFENEKEGFPDPILQVKRQADVLKKWLSQHMNKTFPIHTLVSIGYPSTILETNKGNEQIYNKVLHAEHIPQKIVDLSDSEQHLSTYQLRKLTDQLLNAHVPEPTMDILNYYSISPLDLVKGVPCPKCNQSPMERVHAWWHCQECHTKSKDAHVQPVEDFIWLYGSINNEQCRKHLGLTSSYTTKRILQSMNLQTEGKNKGTVYYLPN